MHENIFHNTILYILVSWIHQWTILASEADPPLLDTLSFENYIVYIGQNVYKYWYFSTQIKFECSALEIAKIGWGYVFYF